MFRLLLAALLTLPTLASAAPAFIDLDVPGGQLNALSRDGLTAAGSLAGAASGGFRWHAGRVELLREAVSARAISASGRYVAGSSLDAAQREVATWWDENGTPHPMSTLPGASGGVLGIATGITDEPRVVGMTLTPDSRSAAFSWRPPHIPVLLPLEAGTSARATGINTGGTCIYGWIEQVGRPRRTAIWKSDADMRWPNADSIGEVLGANPACDVLVGIRRSDDGTTQSWRWSAGQGFSALTDGDGRSAQINASDDIGALLVGSLGSGARRTAAVWTTATGLQPLDRFLRKQDVAIPSGWTLAAATAVSGDGRRIGGWGQHDGRFDSFIVELPVAGRSAPNVPHGEPER